VWAKGVVVATPALDDDLGLLERIDDLAVEQLVAELTSVTPIDRIASATVRPCAVSTSTCRSFATISSAVCRFLDIDPSSSWLRAIPQGGPLLSRHSPDRQPIYLRLVGRIALAAPFKQHQEAGFLPERTPMAARACSTAPTPPIKHQVRHTSSVRLPRWPQLLSPAGSTSRDLPWSQVVDHRQDAPE
jgi:hypothetical protein